MRALAVQHLDIEEPYAVAEALGRAGVEVDVRHAEAGSIPADLRGVDGLVVMGGPMSAYDDAGFPTRREEIALLTTALHEGVPTLGVCLGAQLLAVAAGGEAVPGDAGQEVGWAPVRRVAGDDDRLFRELPPSFPVLHWHGDTVRLPEGAELLASSDRYVNQAFRVGRSAWGLQFHVEVGRTAVERFVRRFGAEPEVLSDTPARLAELAPTSRAILDRLAALVADPVRRTQTFFGPRAAGWDTRFPDDDEAYRTAVRALAVRPDGIVLDVGCGTGRAYPHLAAAARAAVGVDVTPEMLQVARGRSSLLARADGGRLPLPDGAVDGVFAAGFVTHLPDPAAGLAELARVTRPGGRLAVFHPVGRATLAARHGHGLSPDDLLDPANLPDALVAAGWSATQVDDAADRYLATATRRS